LPLPTSLSQISIPCHPCKDVPPASLAKLTNHEYHHIFYVRLPVVLEILQSIQQVMDQQCVRLHRNQQQLVANSLYMIQLLGSLTSWSFSTSRLLRLLRNLNHLHQCKPPETQVYVSMSLLGLIYFVHSCPLFVNTNNIEIWRDGDSGCIHRFE
jgi:hypothetical protein